ncbi:MAG: hypothetical protein HW412_1759 [Bacteroidetes bacterium]|nr:hypothetical protein [Bacteroidota bacterium]
MVSTSSFAEVNVANVTSFVKCSYVDSSLSSTRFPNGGSKRLHPYRVTLDAHNTSVCPTQYFGEEIRKRSHQKRARFATLDVTCRGGGIPCPPCSFIIGRRGTPDLGAEGATRYPGWLTAMSCRYLPVPRDLIFFSCIIASDRVAKSSTRTTIQGAPKRVERHSPRLCSSSRLLTSWVEAT